MYIFLLFLFFSPLAESLCAVEAVYLTWQNDPTTTMTIHWLTDEKSANNRVEYRKYAQQYVQQPAQLPPQQCAQESLPEQAPWQTQEGKHAQLPKGVAFAIHTIELKGLEPDSVYSFRLPEETATYLFRTMPKELKQPVRFAVGGDIYPNELAPFEEMAKKVAQESPRFVMIGGDIAYSVSDKKSRSDDFSRWYTFLQCWTKTMRDQSGCLIPILPAIGNHEVMGYFGQTPEQAKFYYALFSCPGQQGYKALYFGDYLALMLLDSNHTHPIHGAQTEWLQSELRRSLAYTHCFAIYHVPAYPSVRYFRTRESCSIRRHWVPLFEKYFVNAVFENHDHAYKRTYPLVDGSKDPLGVVYFGDGSWGASLRIPKKASRTTYLAKTKSRRQYILVELTEEKRLYQSKTAHGHIIDSYVQEVGKPSPIN